jgi:hypothetical protein
MATLRKEPTTSPNTPKKSAATRGVASVSMRGKAITGA